MWSGERGESPFLCSEKGEVAGFVYRTRCHGAGLPEPQRELRELEDS